MRVLAVLFLVHLWISHFFLPKMGVSDIYPLFNWDLFSFHPQEFERYFVRVHGQEEIVHDWSSFQPREMKGVPYNIDHLGQALESGDQSLIAPYREEFERNVFHQHDRVEYEIVKVRMNSLEYLREKRVQSVRPIQRLVYERH